MKCPKCASEIGECKICPFCGYDTKTIAKDVCKKCGKQGNNYFEGMCEKCYNETYGISNEILEEDNKNKANFLYISQIIVIIAFILGIIIYAIEGLYIVSIILLVTMIVVCVIIQIFKTIINLLQEINSKI